MKGYKRRVARQKAFSSAAEDAAEDAAETRWQSAANLKADWLTVQPSPPKVVRWSKDTGKADEIGKNDDRISINFIVTPIFGSTPVTNMHDKRIRSLYEGSIMMPNLLLEHLSHQIGEFRSCHPEESPES
jgi:hypothetical protein